MKGQAAMEFITTYAWGILVVLIAIGAMFYFGIFDAEDTTNSRCDLWPEFNCDESKVNTDGTIQLQIRNNMGDLSEMIVYMDSNMCTIENTVAYPNPQTHPGIVLSGDRWDEFDDQIIEFSCDDVLLKESIFEADITIDYRERVKELSHTKTGFIRRAVE